MSKDPEISRMHKAEHITSEMLAALEQNAETVADVAKLFPGQLDDAPVLFVLGALDRAEAWARKMRDTAAALELEIEQWRQDFDRRTASLSTLGGTQ